ncbi:MAG: response regulator, partial [Anaerolineae bacterium]|nr:response regulator [Anaerolineae bacterium]
MQTVLAIDDEPLVLNSWKRILEALGARVVEARSGTEALLRLRGQSSFDLVLVDNALPDVRGVDLILRAPRGLRGKMV